MGFCIRFLIIFLCPFLYAFAACPTEPLAVYLTWQHDPTTSMTIQWISHLESLDNLLEYQLNSLPIWKKSKAVHAPLPLNYPGLIHRIELTGLTPDSDYRFRIGKGGQTYSFRTMPKELKNPLRFVVGGDIYHDNIEIVKETNLQAAKSNPHFALLGGDIAYTFDKESLQPESNAERWITWLSSWQKTMVTADGRLIPMITAIGNHDTFGLYGQTPENAPFYYAFFPAIDKGYRTIDFGKYLSIFVLDSGHTHPINGEQTLWLEKALKSRNDTMHKFALYHVGGYPSVRPMDEKMSPQIREHWIPLFEKYGLNAGFEHHDHAYKRTVRIKDGQENSKGVLYLGDGCWGVADPRLPRTQSERWFLAKTVPERHFILVTIDSEKRTFEAFSSTGKKIDSYETKD